VIGRDDGNFEIAMAVAGIHQNCRHVNTTSAQVRELLDALNLITDESNRSNANLEMLFREKLSPFKVSSK
jgi:hypothetical protein